MIISGVKQLINIVISGYYGFGNIGDEGILDSTINILRGYFGRDVDIVVLSANPSYTQEIHGVTAVNRWKVKDVYGALCNSDVLISGGGGLLQDQTSTYSLLYYLYIIAMAKLLKKEVYIFAQGLGPITTKTGRAASRYILEKADGILVRDKGSVELLEKLCVTTTKIVEGRDSIIGSYPFMGNITRIHKGRRIMGVALRDFPGFHDVAPVIAETCDYVSSQLDGEVVFLLMHPNEDNEATKRVCQLMHNEYRIIDENINYHNIVETMLEFDILLGVRMHSLIYALICGVPHIGIAYSRKVIDYMGQVDLPCFELPLCKNEILNAIHDMMGEETIIKERLKLVFEKEKDIFYAGVDKLFAQSRFNARKIDA